MIRCGFYNSLVDTYSYYDRDGNLVEEDEYDREYTAEDLGRLFDGILVDGVYEHFGDCFKVKPYGDGLSISIGTGRSWFDHIWMLNDDAYVMDLGSKETTGDIYYVICIYTDFKNRESGFTYVAGSPGEGIPDYRKGNKSGKYPVYVHPIANVKKRKNATTFIASDITNLVGTNTPYVHGPLSASNGGYMGEWANRFADLVGQYNTMFGKYYEAKVSVTETQTQIVYTDRYLQLYFQNIINTGDLMIDIYVATDEDGGWNYPIYYKDIYLSSGSGMLTILLNGPIGRKADLLIRFISRDYR